jgi:hypothetical protein
MKTIELTGAALDWAVAKCEGFDPETLNTKTGVVYSLRYGVYTPSTDPAQAYPIIVREKIATDPDADDGQWAASTIDAPCYWVGPTLLVAAMRCYVASKLGDTVDVPEEISCKT